jgi:hypothetical protein
MAINTGRVVAGGAVAGLVYNALDMLWNFTLLKADNAEMITRLNLNPALMTDPLAAIPWVVIDFVLGFVTIFVYAGFRPRFGPGARTAVIAGAPLWVTGTAIFCGMASMGVVTEAMVVKSALLTLVNVVLGSIAGAAVYKET